MSQLRSIAGGSAGLAITWGAMTHLPYWLCAVCVMLAVFVASLYAVVPQQSVHRLRLWMAILERRPVPEPKDFDSGGV